MPLSVIGGYEIRNPQDERRGELHAGILSIDSVIGELIVNPLQASISCRITFGPQGHDSHILTGAPRSRIFVRIPSYSYG